MFDNGLNVDENNKVEIKKSSLVTSFTDEELVEMQSGFDKPKKDESDKKSGKENVKVFEEVKTFKSNGYTSASPYLSLRSNIERMLGGRDYEEKLVSLVDTILLNEQNALSDETKKKVQLEKYIFGLAFTSCNCYGDQQNFLYLMADRLGVRR